MQLAGHDQYSRPSAIYPVTIHCSPLGHLRAATGRPADHLRGHSWDAQQAGLQKTPV